MKLLLENWRRFLAEAEGIPLPGAGKYKITMPLKDIYKIFMETIEDNLESLKGVDNRVADDPQQLAAKLTEIFEPEDLNVKFQVSKERFDALGDGAFLHGKVSSPEETKEGERTTVTMVLNKYTGEVIKKWDKLMKIKAEGYTSARTVTGKQLMAHTTRNTVVHEFVHQAQAEDPDIRMTHKKGSDEDIKERELYAELAELLGVPEGTKDFGDFTGELIEKQVSQEFLDGPKTEDDKRKRDIINQVYYSNESEFTGWAQGMPSELIDAALRGKIPEAKNKEGAELKEIVIRIIESLIQDVSDKGSGPSQYKEHSNALRFYGHPEGFMATYGVPGYKAFLQLAKGYADKYPESMYK